MKITIGKLDVSAWRWNGRQLANPFVILLRAALMPVVLPCSILLVLAVWIGWGRDAADDIWDVL